MRSYVEKIKNLFGAKEKVDAEGEREDLLRESERRFKDIFYSSSDAIFILEDGKFIDCNDSAVRMLGCCNRKEITGLDLRQISPASQGDGEDSSGKADLMIKEAFKNGYNRCEWITRKKDGKNLPVEISLTPISHKKKEILFCVLRERSKEKKIEKALYDKQKKLSATLRSMGDAVITTDADGRIVEFNSVSEDLTGWKRAEVKGLFTDEVLSLVAPETREKVASPVKKTLQEGRSVKLAEYTILIDREGKEHNISDSCSPIRGNEGNIIGSVLVFREVTEEYLRQKKLQKSRKRLSTILDSLHAMVFITDIRTNELLFVNKHAREVWDEQGKFDECWIKMVEEENASCAFCKKENILSPYGNPADACEGEFRDEKTSRWYYRSDRAIEWTDGRFARMVVAVDITDQKLASEKLAKSKERFEQLAKCSRTFIWEVDNQGRYTYVSDAVKDILGYYPEEIIGKKFFYDFFPDEDREELKQMGLSVLKEGRSLTDFENRVVAKDGSVGWCLTNGMPFCDEKNVQKGWRGSDIDITRRKKIEEDLKRSERHNRSIIELFPDIIMRCDKNGVLLDVISSSEEKLYLSEEEILGKNLSSVLSRKTAYVFMEALEKTFRTEELQKIEYQMDISGELLWFEARLIPSSDEEVFMMIRDITETKISSVFRTLSRDILKILNSRRDLKECVEESITAIKKATGCDAAGMRLLKDGDFPYFAHEGFPEDFLKTENTVTSHDSDGDLCRDDDGNILLECTCGLVLSGKTDSEEPFFTAGGSFWTNDAFSLVEMDPEDDPRLSPRNKCTKKGFGSVALVPLRAEERIVGLLQLNFRRKNAFSQGTINSLEQIAGHIGSTYMRDQAEKKTKAVQKQLRQSNRRYKALVENVPGIVYRCLNDKDWTMLFISEEFRRLTGYHEAGFLNNSERTFNSIIHPEDKSLVQKSIEESLVGGNDFAIEYRLVCSDGRIVWVQDKGRGIFDDATKAEVLDGVIVDITERKKYEKALAENEKQLNLFFSQSIDGCFFMMLEEPIEWNDSVNKEKVLDYVFEHQHMTKFNQALLDQYWVEEDSFMGITPQKLFEHDPEHGREVWRDLFDRGRWRTVTNERRTDGSLMWVQGDYICFYDDKGRITGHFGVQRDITQQKKQQKRNRFEMRFLELATAFSVRLSGMDKDDYDFIVNEFLCDLGELFNADRTYVFKFSEDLDKMTNTNEWCAEGVTSQKSRIKNVPTDSLPWWRSKIERGEPLSISNVDDLPDAASAEKKEFKAQNICSLLCLPMQSSEGSLVGILGMELVKRPKKWLKKDINMSWVLAEIFANARERMRTSESLQKAVHERDILLNNIQTQTWYLMDENTYGAVNNAHAGFLGLKREDMMFRTMRDIFPEEVAETCYKSTRKVYETKRAYLSEEWMTNASGEKRLLSILKTPKLDEKGEVEYVVCSAEDITERKKSEEQMKLALDMQVEFISTGTHELRTPLSAIKEGIAIVADGSCGEINAEQKEFLNTASRNVKRLSELINDVLGIQQLKSGKARLEIEKTDLNALIEESHKQMRAEAVRKDLNFCLDLEDDLPEMRIDQEAILRVLLNLISNAFKYTEKGYVRITSRLDSGGKSVRVAVEDTGSGIKSSDLSKLFKEFEQLEKGNNRKPGGTGLGLAIIKRIIDIHGVSIWAES